MISEGSFYILKYINIENNFDFDIFKIHYTY